MSYNDQLLEHLKRSDYIPSTTKQLAEQLGLKGRQITKLKTETQQLLKRGIIVKIKGDRLCLPREADLQPGTIYFRQSGSAWVIPEGQETAKEKKRILIRSEDTWVALHKDRVLVRNIPQKMNRFRKGGRGKPVDTEEPHGRVIRILERARDTLTGTLRKSRMYWYVIPDDPRINPDILVPGPERSDLFPPPEENDKVIVKLDPWEQRHLNPSGTLVQVLGKTHTPRAEHDALLHQYDLDPNFPPVVMEEVDQTPHQVLPSQISNRRDMRNIFTFTIDPDDAKDFDDALSIEHLDDGLLRVGIHIADVSFYVKAGSELDKEAKRRGNSTYLVGQVIPMLPHALSNGICSLVEAQDRLVKSVFLTFDKTAKILNTQFDNSVIRSFKRLTYKQAYAFLKHSDFAQIRATPMPPRHQTGSTGRTLEELTKAEMQQLQRAIRELWGIASKLRSKRMRAGSLELDMPETKIYVDELGYADRLERVENDESHQLIEEFMLSANEAVARELLHANMPLIHRVHDKPDEERLRELREYLYTVGIEVGDLTKRGTVNKMLKLIKEHPQAHILRVQFLRTLPQACYRADADGHYGLNKRHYAHFTSPIRRYADLVVHRQFDAHLQKTGCPTAPKGKLNPCPYSKLVNIAQHISLTEQNSSEAERESNKVKLLEFFERELAKEQQTVFKAVIVDVKNHGMFVELPLEGAYGLVHISTMQDDHYLFDHEQNTFTGKRHQRKFRTGDDCLVITERVDRFKRQIDFRIVDSR